MPAFDPKFDERSVAVCKGLSEEYKRLTQKTDCLFLDASIVAAASPIDQEHLDETGHHALANAVAKKIRNS